MFKLVFSFSIFISPWLILDEKNLSDFALLLQEENVTSYKVELIVIKHLYTEEKDREETWPELEEYLPSDNLILLSSEPTLLVKKDFIANRNRETYLLKEPIKNLDNNTLFVENKFDFSTYPFFEKITLRSSIKSILKKLNLSKGYRVLFESTWIQPIHSSDYSFPVYIENINENNKIFGELSLYKDRYLHSNINFRFAIENQFGINKPSIVTNNFNNIIDSLKPSAKINPKNNNYWIQTIFSKLDFKISKTERIQGDEIDLIAKKETIKDSRFFDDKYELQESIKMKEEIFHYIDHPYFGVLLRVSPVK